MVPDINTDGESAVSETVIEAVAETANVDTTALPPLYYYVESDALNKLFGRRRTGASAITTEFVYDGYEVRVIGGDEVTVTVEERPETEPGAAGIDIE